jgi:hypothetical protein
MQGRMQASWFALACLLEAVVRQALFTHSVSTLHQLASQLLPSVYTPVEAVEPADILIQQSYEVLSPSQPV